MSFLLFTFGIGLAADPLDLASTLRAAGYPQLARDELVQALPLATDPSPDLWQAAINAVDLSGGRWMLRAFAAATDLSGSSLLLQYRFDYVRAVAAFDRGQMAEALVRSRAVLGPDEPRAAWIRMMIAYDAGKFRTAIKEARVAARGVRVRRLVGKSVAEAVYFDPVLARYRRYNFIAVNSWLRGGYMYFQFSRYDAADIY